MPCIRVAATQLHNAPVSHILELPHDVSQCHTRHFAHLPHLFHIKGSSPHHVAQQSVASLCAQSVTLVPPQPRPRKFVCPFATSRVQVMSHFWAHLPSLFALSEPCCFMKLHIGPCSHKQNDQEGLKTLHIWVTVTQVHIAPVFKILELPHAVPQCHKWHCACLLLLLHIKGSSPHPVAQLSVVSFCAQSVTLVPPHLPAMQICWFVHNQKGSGCVTFFGAPSFTLSALSEPCCFKKPNIGSSSHKQNE